MRTRSLSCVLLVPFALLGQDVKQFSIVIDKPDTEYTVHTAGTMDPENVEITIENLGDTPLVNPRMTVNGLYDWYDAKSMAAEITRGCTTDEEKALAIWSWVRYRTFQRSPRDESSLHPVRAMNGYGYGICGHVAAWMKCLWTAAGVKARVQELWGHTVSEAFYNGAWHMLDGNVKVFYLDRDNRTIASLATLEHDRWLIERTIHPREFQPWFIGPDPPGRNEQFVRYLISYKDNYEEHSYDAEIAKEYTMAMTLKPGETLTRWWTPELGKFEGRSGRAEAPRRYANGRLTWEPDLRRTGIRQYLSIPSYGNVATHAEDGRGPAVHVADLQDSLYTRPSVFSIPIVSAYPIVGGRFSCTLVREGSSGLDQATISFGRSAWGSEGDLYSIRWGGGTENADLDLDSRLAKGDAPYAYNIAFALRGNAEAKPPTQAGFDAFRSVTDLQVSPHSLPALVLVNNTVHFWHQSPGPVKVRITHRWRQIDGPRLPEAPKAAITPADGDEAGSLTPLLRWLAVSDATDYQVMVSLRPDCRWPVATTLHQNVGSPKAEWTVPATFLNPGTTYYWKVRSRNSRGDVGEWGRVFRFRTAANAR